MSKYVTFRQADSRWGNMPYPRKPYYMKDVGCGPTACASIIYNIKRDVTPKETANWMIRHGYALPGNGTAANGITACLKAYGYTVKVHNNMPSFWAACNAGNVAGIIWFRKGTRGGVTWTTTGHYVAFAGYKYENGKHYLYTRDPGGRHNDGWHCYETQMYGLIVELWTVNVPSDPKTLVKWTNGASNIRAGRGVSYKVIATVPYGTQLKVYNYASSWYQIYEGQYKGYYIASSVLLDAKPGSKYKTLMVMNVRSGASTNYKVVGQIPKGKTFRATKYHGNWVWTPDYNGWVCTKDSKTQYCTRVL